MARKMAKQADCKHSDWRPLRGGKAEVCVDCGMRFPCKDPSCIHSDCMERRGFGVCIMCGKKMRKIDYVIVDAGRQAFCAHPACRPGMRVTVED